MQALNILFNNDTKDWTSLLDMVYPVGKLYISKKNISPASFLGGSWTQINGYYLRAGENTGTAGADTHTLAVSEIPGHQHSIGNHTHALNNHTHNVGHTHRMGMTTSVNGYGLIYNSSTEFRDISQVTGNRDTSTTNMSTSGPSSGTGQTSFTTGEAGSGSSYNCMPKYQNLYIWKRTA